MISAVLLAPLIIGLLSAILAALIAVMDKIVNNYGQVALDINQGAKTLQVTGGSPLLFTLAEQKIFLPSACGGKGTCGTCKVKIHSGVTSYLPTEIPLLTEQEIREHTHLGCQVKVKSNLAIGIPEELFNIKEYATVVTAIKDVTYDIKEIFLKLQEPAVISFKAGQYAQLVIPPYGKIKGTTQRAYSILSTPRQQDSVGFLIRLVPGGIATTYLHQHLQVGDKLRIIAPVGEFHLRRSAADMICIAGGSGMAPIYSILFDMLENRQTGRNVWYFFGARSGRDLFYAEEFRQLEQQWPTFHFVPTLTEPRPGDNWQGETGLVTQVVERYLKERLNPAAPKEGYLCGSPGMIAACIQVLTAGGLAPEVIYYDKFA